MKTKFTLLFIAIFVLASYACKKNTIPVTPTILGTWHYTSVTGTIAINNVFHNNVSESNFAAGDKVVFVSGGTGITYKTDTTQLIGPGNFNYTYDPATRNLTETPVPADITAVSIIVSTLTSSSLVYHQTATQTAGSDTTYTFTLVYSFSR